MNKVMVSPDNWGGVVCSMRTISNRRVDLTDVKPSMIDIEDIAHSLHQINRFNGHAVRPYNVLAHSMCASALMPHGKRMEGLLHDAAEAYIGDITTPVKELFPTISIYENILLAIILEKYDKNKEANIVKNVYKKSPVMLSVDRRLGAGEHAVLRPKCKSKFDAYVAHMMDIYWDATPEDFIKRYEALL